MKLFYRLLLIIVSSSILYSYDFIDQKINGKIKEVVCFKYDMNKNKEELVDVQNKKYDIDGNLIEESYSFSLDIQKEYYLSNKLPVFFKKYYGTFRYINLNKSEIIKKFYSGDKLLYEDKQKITYNSKGNILKIEDYDKNGKIYNEINYYYDNKNTLIKIEYLDKENNEVNYCTLLYYTTDNILYKTENQGYISSWCNYDKNGLIIESSVFKYEYIKDTIGNVLEKKCYWKETNELTVIFKYKYLFWD